MRKATYKGQTLYFSENTTPTKIWDYISSVCDVPYLINHISISWNEIVAYSDDECCKIEILDIKPIF